MSPEGLHTLLSAAAEAKRRPFHMAPSVATWRLPLPCSVEREAHAPAACEKSTWSAAPAPPGDEEITVRWMASGEPACTVRACRLVAGVQAQIRDSAGVPVEEQCLYAAGDRAVSLREAVYVPDGVADLSLVRSFIDPRKTDLDHFRFKGEFGALPAGDFVQTRTLADGINGHVRQYLWRRPQGDVQVAVKRIAATKIRGIPLTETNERVVHCRLASRKPMAELEDPLAEIGILSYLSRQADLSSNLLRMLGAFSDGADVWVVTELAEGGELFEAVSSGRVHGEAQARQYTREMLQAVAYLHKHHIGHRDISLENTLLTKSGTAQVMDFGMAVRSHSSSGLALRYFRAAGKPGYRAPECYVPEAEEVTDVVCPADALPGDVRMVRLPGAFSAYLAEVRLPPDAEPRKACKAEVWGYAVQPADVFAVGICFFIMCYQCPLFREAHLADANFAWVYGRGEGGISGAVRGWGLELFPQEATSLLERMLSFDPARRPPSAECLAHPWLVEPMDLQLRLAAGGA